MKLNTVLYISPKEPVESLDKILPTMPGERPHISLGFVSKLTDDQFRELCKLKNDFIVNEKAARLIHARMERLGIKYSIDYKNKTFKTQKDGT